MAVKESQFISPGTTEDPYLRGGGIFIYSESQNEKKNKQFEKKLLPKSFECLFQEQKKQLVKRKTFQLCDVTLKECSATWACFSSEWLPFQTANVSTLNLKKRVKTYLRFPLERKYIIL